MVKVSIDNLEPRQYYTMIKPNTGYEKIYIDKIKETNSGHVIYYHSVRKNGSMSDKLQTIIINENGPIEFEKDLSILSAEPSSSLTTITSSTSSLTSSTSSSSAKPVISCTHGVEILHQYTGQCWNDASIIFLWFSSGIGPIIQRALQDDSLLEDFTTWINDKTIRDQLIAIFPDILNQDYDYFVTHIIAYLDNLQRRYALWSSLESPTKEKNKAQRKLSCNLSEESQLAGQKASESLYFNRHSIQIFESKNIDPGYNTVKIGNIYYILLHFFLQGNIVLDVFHPRYASTYGSSLPQFNKLVLLHNPYIITQDLSKQSPVYYQSIFDRIGPNYRISLVVSFEKVNKYKHAVSFLTCSEGNEFFYDNNYFEFVSLNWSAFFRNVDQTMVSLAYVIQPHESANIEGIPIPHQEPILFILFNMANHGSLSFYTTNGLIHTVNDLREYSFFKYRPSTINREWGNSLLSQLLTRKCHTVYYLLGIDFLLFDPVNLGNQDGSLQKFLVANTNATNKYYLQKKLNMKAKVEKNLTLNPHISRNKGYTSGAYRQKLERHLIEETILRQAIDDHQYDIAAELIKYYLEIDVILQLLIRYVNTNNKDSAELILNNIEDNISHVRDYEHGGTYMGRALAIAVMRNNRAIIELILKKGVEDEFIKSIYQQINDDDIKDLLLSYLDDDDPFKREQSVKKAKKGGKRKTRKSKDQRRKTKKRIKE